VAKQQGAYVARGGGPPVAPFQYRDYGMLATIGRSHAMAQFGRVKLSGFPAWLLYCCAHISFLIGFRSRLFVTLNWAWNFLAFRRGARLIIVMGGAPMRD
jgi:NADH dehydrogenase